MKRIVHYILLLVGVVVSAVSCKEVSEDVGAPSFTIQSEVTIPGEGGTFTVPYTLENPTSGAELKYSVEKDWVKSVDISVAGEVTIEVEHLYGSEGRSCRIEFMYPGIYPNPVLKVNQPVGMEAAFGFNVKKVTANTIYMDVVPKDKTQPYVFLLGKKSYMVEDGLLDDDEAQIASDLAEIGKFGMAFGGVPIEMVIGAFMYQGDQIDFTWSGVQTGTEYVAYAYGFDVETMTATTEVCRVEITTLDVQYFKVDFDLDVQVDGPNVSFDITPKGYDGYYFFGVFDAASCPQDTTTAELMMSYCESSWEEYKGVYSSFFESEEEGLHFIFNELAYSGTTHFETELTADTEYVLWAVGMDERALLNTIPVAKYFTTSSAKHSDNEFTITISDISSREATVTVETTNDDPYVALITTSQRFAGMTDEEIMDEVCTSWNYTIANGGFTTKATGLTPNTEYQILAFGINGGRPSTGITRKTFTTTNPVYSNVEFSLSVGNYYDLAEVAALDPDWEAYTSNDLVVGVTAVYDTQSVQDIYFGVADLHSYSGCTEEELIKSLLAENPSDDVEYFLLDYDWEFVFYGIAKDNDGELTRLWSSKNTIFKKSGISPAEEFLASINGKSESAPLLGAMRLESKNVVDFECVLTRE